MSDPGPRIAPLPPDRWDESVTAALRRAGMAEVPPDRLGNAVTTLLRHPGLAGPFLAYNGVLLWKPALPARWRELVILRVAWRAGCAYEWLQHVRLAGRGDITAAEVEAVTVGADAPGWGPPEADLLAAADQLLDVYEVDDRTWERLREHLDERQLMELVFVVGTYSCLAMVFNTFGIQPDADLEPTARMPRRPGRREGE